MASASQVNIEYHLRTCPAFYKRMYKELWPTDKYQVDMRQYKHWAYTGPKMIILKDCTCSKTIRWPAPGEEVDMSDEGIRRGYSRYDVRIVHLEASSTFDPVSNVEKIEYLAEPSKCGETASGWYFRTVPTIRPDGHMGNDSIVTKGVVNIKQTIAGNVTNDLVRGMLRHTSPDRISVLDNFGVQIMGELSMRLPFITRETFTIFPRTLPRASHMLDFNIHFRNSLEKARYDPDAAAIYIRGGIVNFRVLASSLQGMLSIPREVAESMAPIFMNSLTIFDNSAIFTIAYLMEDYLLTAERMGIQLLGGPSAADRVELINLQAVGDEQIKATVLNISDHIFKGTIALRWRYIMSHTTYSVLVALATGIQYFMPPDQEMQPIHRCFRTDGMHFLIWDDAPINTGPIVPLHSSDIKFFASGLATTNGWQDDYVKGYIRGATIINGLIDNEPTAAATVPVAHEKPPPGPVAAQHAAALSPESVKQVARFYTAMFETYAIELPRPKSSNILWSVLNLNATIPKKQYFMDDYYAASGMSEEYRQLVAAGMAAVLSLGASNVLHNINITGREMNNCANGNGIGGINQMFEKINGYKTAAIFALACGFVPQITTLNVHPDCFRTSNFYCRGIGRIKSNQAWQATWPRRIPYIVRPESLSWVIVKWAHHWAITGTGVEYNFRQGLVTSVDHQCINFALCETLYDRVLQANTGFVYIPYGHLAINVIRQDFRLNNHIRVSYRRTQWTGRDLIEPGGIEEGDEFQPIYDDNLYTSLPGTVITWDWETETQLRPYLARRNMPPEVWISLITAPSVKRLTAGYILSGILDGLIRD